MSTQPPQEPPRDQAPPGYREPPTTAYPTGNYAPAEERGHVGPWILAAAIVLVLGALAAVLIHNADTSDTQTVITRPAATVNTTSVDRSGPTVTQSTTTVAPPERTTTTVTVQPKTQTETQTPTTTTTSP